MPCLKRFEFPLSAQLIKGIGILFDNRSYVLSYHKQWHYNDWIDVGYRLGGITGYTKEENSVQLFGITPLISPTINFHYKGFGIETAIQTDVFIFSLNYTF